LFLPFISIVFLCRNNYSALLDIFCDALYLRTEVVNSDSTIHEY